jgi:primosomal protein N' (replication factor Y)
VRKPSSEHAIIVRCWVPSPLRQCLDYVWSDEQRAPQPGIRVRVPLGPRKVVGIIHSIVSEPAVAREKLRQATALDEQPLLSDCHRTLLEWVADYYQHPAGEVAQLALCARERRGDAPAKTTETALRLSERARGLPENALSRAPKQAALLARLQAGAETLPALKKAGFSSAVIQALVARELIEPIERDMLLPWRTREALEANSEQAAAISACCESLGRFVCHLLQGVTGSGKTEVYLQAIARVIEAGNQALVLVPEIGLTPQMVERFEARFDAPVVTLHSDISSAERDRSWAAARDGSAAVVIGTRSAIFADFARLGLIIVDEEHDTAFRQQDGLRYSARDVAIKRAQLLQCPVVLGSATPSLESWRHAQSGRYQWHRLTRRAGHAKLPSRQIVDVRGLALAGGLAPETLNQVSQTLSRGEQILIFLNRRGFAHTLLCSDCGWRADCHQCDARMTLHRQPPRLHCHHCDHKIPLPKQCPQCKSSRLVGSGVGTEQTEMLLREQYPDVPLFRVDRDAMRGRHAIEALRSELDALDAAILVGTQMLSKGHHFPKVTLVVVVDADALLLSPDYRGEERLLQLVTQVAGRAGRAERSGHVIIQTRQPQHPLIESVLVSPFDELAEKLLSDRTLRGLPPIGAIGLIRCDCNNLESGFKFLETLSKQLPDTRSTGAKMIGPITAPMARRAGRYRVQLIVVALDRPMLGRILRQITALAAGLRKPRQLDWFIDIDPIDAF